VIYSRRKEEGTGQRDLELSTTCIRGVEEYRGAVTCDPSRLINWDMSLLRLSALKVLETRLSFLHYQCDISILMLATEFDQLNYA
jgi:hypothetical protein